MEKPYIPQLNTRYQIITVELTSLMFKKIHTKDKSLIKEFLLIKYIKII
jgi:hypothetical protein